MANPMPAWQVDELPEPPKFSFEPWKLLGPGLVMVGSSIGAGEWLMGPAITCNYGGTLMWIATISILLQAVYNLEVMRYTLACGEPIFVGFFRTLPGPRFWTVAYLVMDFGAIWPYLAANAAVVLVTSWYGRAPVVSEQSIVQWTGYGVFILAFVPLLFGGKIYRAIELVMFTKIFLVLGYLTFLAFFHVEWATWSEIFLGFIQFGQLPEVGGSLVTWRQIFQFEQHPSGAPPIDLALLASFVAIAGTGGLNNTTFSNYTREKGWGMGSRTGAIASFIGGRGITLSHYGKTFPLDEESLRRFNGWRWLTIRDQFGIWVVGCILGLAIPCMISLQYAAGQQVTKDNVSTLSATGLAAATGSNVFLYLTLFCGFLVLGPSQLATVDGMVRRWTDAVWSTNGWARRLPDDKVAVVYYTILVAYLTWGIFVLVCIPSPLVLVKVGGLLMNFALGASSIHALVVNCTLLPRPLRPGWGARLGLVACAIFFIGVSAMGVPKAIEDLTASSP